jgi:hypothetical protein
LAEIGDSIVGGARAVLGFVTAVEGLRRERPRLTIEADWDWILAGNPYGTKDRAG